MSGIKFQKKKSEIGRSTLNLLEKGKTIFFKTHYTVGAAKDTFEAFESPVRQGLNSMTAESLASPEGALGLRDELTGPLMGEMGLFGNVGMGVLLVTSLPDAVAHARESIRAAVRTGSIEDKARAMLDTTVLGRGLLYTGTKLVSMTATTVKLATTYQAASEAFRLAAPYVPDAVASAAALAAAKGVYEGASASATQILVNQAVGGVSIAGAQAASTAAVAAGAEMVSGPFGHLASWLAPGVNLAIMTFDLLVAAATVANPKSTIGKKVTTCITAAGSIAAATNIPVVSQAGAAVAFASALMGYFL